jgi:hypothetical protein
VKVLADGMLRVSRRPMRASLPANTGGLELTNVNDQVVVKGRTATDLPARVTTLPTHPADVFIPFERIVTRLLWRRAVAHHSTCGFPAATSPSSTTGSLHQHVWWPPISGYQRTALQRGWHGALRRRGQRPTTSPACGSDRRHPHRMLAWLISTACRFLRLRSAVLGLVGAGGGHEPASAVGCCRRCGPRAQRRQSRGQPVDRVDTGLTAAGFGWASPAGVAGRSCTSWSPDSGVTAKGGTELQAKQMESSKR